MNNISVSVYQQDTSCRALCIIFQAKKRKQQSKERAIYILYLEMSSGGIDGSDFLLCLLALFFPFVPVIIRAGFWTKDTAINFLLLLTFAFPAIFHAWWVIYKTSKKRNNEEYNRQQEILESGAASNNHQYQQYQQQQMHKHKQPHQQQQQQKQQQQQQ